MLLIQAETAAVSGEPFGRALWKVPTGTPNSGLIASQDLPACFQLEEPVPAEDPPGAAASLPAAGAFFTPATTLCTIIPRSSSLKADVTEIMNRPIGELSSVLSPGEVASRANPSLVSWRKVSTQSATERDEH